MLKMINSIILNFKISDGFMESSEYVHYEYFHKNASNFITKLIITTIYGMYIRSFI